MSSSPVISPSEADLSRILASADRRTLAAVVIHLTGDVGAIKDLRDRGAIEALAMGVLPAFLDGSRSPGEPSDEVLRQAMNVAAGEEVPAPYAPLVREQMGFGPSPEPAPLVAPEGFHVAIIGGGVTGILAGIMLDRLGLSSFTILDKNPEPGGTWWQNTYPGCRVDTPSLLYSFSFDQDPGWPEHFSHQPELLAYVKRSVEHNRLADRLRCGVEVAAMGWDEDAARWVLTLRSEDGHTEELVANFVIGASGLLRIPRYPDMVGQEDFAGPRIHTARWDAGVDLTGKRVAIIGTGASANQVVPAIAAQVDQLFVYQRSPHWMMAHPQYGKMIEGDERWLVEHLPTYRQWYRFRQFWVFGDSILDSIKIDPDWPHPERSVNAANDRFRAMLTEYVENQLAAKPDLIDKVLPDYPPYAKRMVVDNGWFKTLLRDNVQLRTAPIERLTATGVATTEGHDEVDVVIFATGFYTNKVLSPIEITGRGGVDVRANLDDHPDSYNGMALRDCPNLLITYGPHGVPAHGGNGMFFAETAITYITSCLRAMFERGWRSLEVRPEAVQEFSSRMDDEVLDYVWNTPGVTSWFRGGTDTPAVVAPRKLVELWYDAKSPDLSAFRGA